MKKLIFLAILIWSSVSETRQPEFTFHKSFNDRGQSFVMIINHSNRVGYCTITADKYFVDFYIQPRAKSRYYQEPYGYYQWRCI